MVQVYGLGLEYGFVSDNQREGDTHEESPAPPRGHTQHPGDSIQVKGGCHSAVFQHSFSTFLALF